MQIMAGDQESTDAKFKSFWASKVKLVAYGVFAWKPLFEKKIIGTMCPRNDVITESLTEPML